MRIVAGKWRGRAIATPPDDSAIRPTADRARESIFNILFSNYGLPESARVLDLFCGTGALGLEALSRGATHCTFIDNDGDALRLVKTTVEKFGATDDTKVLLSSAEKLPVADEPCDLVFLDPPYRQNLVPVALEQLRLKNWLAAGALLVVETASDETILLPEGFVQLDARRYGAAQILFIKAD
ncbi:MAG: 16S rRNA (guanine(966)-N(2))-methyltransferase RsmD [Bdellovibrionales bacterium]